MTGDTGGVARGGADVALRVADVEMRFADVVALRGVSFTVRHGSLCGVIGPNGAGKTTTLRLLVTDLTPTFGTVEVLGQSVPAGAARVRPRLGYMPDSAGLYEELTLREYLSFFAAFYGLRGRDRRTAVETTIEMVRIRHFADRRLRGLSKGERQRILLARTLIHDPDLLVLDEPADGLDPRGRVELRELLLLLSERGKTIVISSHILADLQEMCSDLVVMNHGRVVFEGGRAQLRSSASDRCRVRIQVAEAPDRLLARLRSATEVTVQGLQDRMIEVSMPAAADFAVGLLRSLVDADIPIVSFAREAETLESIYLRLTSDEDGA